MHRQGTEENSDDTVTIMPKEDRLLIVAASECWRYMSDDRGLQLQRESGSNYHGSQHGRALKTLFKMLPYSVVSIVGRVNSFTALKPLRDYQIDSLQISQRILIM